MECFIRASKWTKFIDENFYDVREPFVAGIELLPQCNFKCVHCYIESDRIENKSSMDFDEIKGMIDILVNHNCIELFLTGGEVLLHKDFIRIYKYAKEQGLLVSVLTNGSLITEEHIKLWKEYPPELVSITLYGATAETYQKVTGVKNGYALVKKAIEKLIKENIKFELKTIGIKENVDEILDMRNYIRNLNINNSLLAWDIRPMNNGCMQTTEHRVSIEKISEIERNDSELNVFWHKIAMHPDLYKKTLRQEKHSLYPCAIAQQFVFITHDGLMRGCVKEVKVAYDLLHGNFDEGWAYLKKELIDKIADASFPCSDCDKFRYCGQCTAMFNAVNDDPNQPVNFYCKLGEARKKYIEELLNCEQKL